MRHKASDPPERGFAYLERLYRRHGLDPSELDAADVAELADVLDAHRFAGAPRAPAPSPEPAPAYLECGERFALLAGGEGVCSLELGHKTQAGEPSAHSELERTRVILAGAEAACFAEPAWFRVGAAVVLDSTYRPAPVNGIPTTIVAIRPNAHGHRLAELALRTPRGAPILVHSWELAEQGSTRAANAYVRSTERQAKP